ncbi:hypothetical protein RYX36_019857 [Vicia faba]
MFTSVHAKYKRLLQKLVLNWSNKAFCPKGYTAFILFIIHEAVWGFFVSSILFNVICHLYFLILSILYYWDDCHLGQNCNKEMSMPRAERVAGLLLWKLSMAAVLTRLKYFILG